MAWGTTGIYNNGQSVIVKSARSVPMTEEIRIEQGGGLTATSVIVNDGDMMEITVDDDRAVTWPIAGGTVNLINPQPNGTYGTAELFQVYNNNYNVNMKQQGERTLICKRYTIITPTQM